MTITAKQLAGNQRRSLRAIRAQLINMSRQWDEVDQFCLGELEDLADAVGKVADNLVGDDKPEDVS